MSMNIDDKRLGLLMLLVKLRVIGATHQKYSIASTMIVGHPHMPPPCSIQLAITGLALEYIQFVPLSKRSKL